MLRAWTHNPVASVVLAGIVCLAIPAGAANSVKLSGAIAGRVMDAAGVAQMGATVILFNRQDRQFQRILTDNQGAFKFIGLLPDIYSLKVTFASFVPAIRKNILVQPGMRSVLNVNLNTLFSTIQFAYPPVENGSLMSDEWKWVLRGASPTRPVLRFTGDALARSGSATSAHTAVFSGTRGILKVSAGDGPVVSGVGNEADLGTAFALATSLFGNNMVQVSGNVGYGSQTGVPTAAFRTSYSRNMGAGSPEVSVTMRQLFLPGRLGSAIAGSDSALPMVRAMSASFDDRAQLTDDLSVQYGFTLNSISFLDHLNYASPYARLNWSTGDGGTLEVAFTSGDARPELAGRGQQDADLQQSLNTLGLFPRISLREARPHIQRGENYEVTYSRKVGSRTYLLSAYRESVTNAALSIVAPAGMYSGGDILPDLFTGSSIFNAGDYHSTGYTAAVTQNVGEHVSATVMYGSMGALTAEAGEVESNSPDDLRNMIRSSRQRAATARVDATSPWTGTHMIASYQWTGDHRAVTPGHMYGTEDVRQMPGMNIYIRQPIPGLGILPWRVEATADLRNLLAQGYLPLGVVGGQSLLLVETPRSFRGGLSFIF
jgi:carboxypeptidase family protein